MTGKTGAERLGSTAGTPDGASRWAGAPRGLRRVFARAADPDRSSRRAGVDLSPAVLMTPRMWVALG